MTKILSETFHNLMHLFFPHVCEGCGTDILDNDALLCAICHTKLPETNFIEKENNLVEQKFYGQLKVDAAGAAFYFTKEGMLQHLIKQLKYHNNKQIGFYLGRQLGNFLAQTNRFNDVDVIIPLPLNPRKEKKRGYNQAAVIAEGVNSIWQKPVNTKAVERKIFTETQTHKDRINRWQSMRNVFEVTNADELSGKNILLIDDIITTGATLEACGEKILCVPNTKLFIATVAFTI
ncbi:ComF family protein [Panacibacter ginsenosidivorans]|uniref:ComF family protein n=1 Tax=Panacibacter ginsenosidivorans TaxID=1813871 RepID=A0A5B8VEL3_9BACT|nr:ComF family protein [Panacibacter ginsenosidivorans]QEC69401.1 ComF family protein [Panacibacter ginsenosidivorans]